jgi:colanic acid biosynthesis protein WcaH
MLDSKTFKQIVSNTPLVSIDLCLLFGKQILLGKRNNEPLKGEWFTPGGRIYKNESWQNCLVRIAKSELGYAVTKLDDFILMGVYDHFYPNSILDSEISTHYVNLPHYINLNRRLDLSEDSQHSKLKWFDLDFVAKSRNFNHYTRVYASYLLKENP